MVKCLQSFESDRGWRAFCWSTCWVCWWSRRNVTLTDTPLPLSHTERPLSPQRVEKQVELIYATHSQPPSPFPLPLQQVRYLKIIEKSGYQALPWVRYITQNGGKVTTRRMVVHSAPMCSYWATVGQCCAIWWERALFWCSFMKRGYNVEHEAMWQGPAKCMKVETLSLSHSLCFFGFFFVLHIALPQPWVLRKPRLHMLIFSRMFPVIAEHPPPISFCSIHSKHQLPTHLHFSL